jgi:hypothetical protein
MPEMDRFLAHDTSVSLFSQRSQEEQNIGNYVAVFVAKTSDQRVFRASNHLGPERKAALREVEVREFEVPRADVKAGEGRRFGVVFFWRNRSAVRTNHQRGSNVEVVRAIQRPILLPQGDLGPTAPQPESGRQQRN